MITGVKMDSPGVVGKIVSSQAEDFAWELLARESGNRVGALRAFMAFHGVPVKDLAGSLGCSPTHVSLMLNGGRKIQAAAAEKFKALGVPPVLLPSLNGAGAEAQAA